MTQSVWQSCVLPVRNSPKISVSEPVSTPPVFVVVALRACMGVWVYGGVFMSRGVNDTQGRSRPRTAQELVEVGGARGEHDEVLARLQLLCRLFWVLFWRVCVCVVCVV